MSKSANISEKLIRRRRVYRGQAVDFLVDKIRLPGGGTAVREYLDHPGAVALVAPLDSPRHPNPRLLFVRQFRHPVGQVTYEIPAGKLDPGEGPLVCARRELEEETGYKARRLRYLLSYWPTPAFANEIIHLYVARDLRPGRFNPDADEKLLPAILRLQDALGKIRRGYIRDSKTIIALLAFKQWG